MNATDAEISHLRRQSTATAEGIEAYDDLLNTARAGLEDHLEWIDEKFGGILGPSATESGVDADKVKTIREERLSTEKCLQICAQLSDQIDQIQRTAKLNTRRDSTDSGSLSGMMVDGGLEECKESLARTALRLEGCEKQVFARLLDKFKTASPSEEDRVDLERLREEWQATRQGMEICSKAHDCLKDSVSTIDNYATGDGIQFLVSTGEKTVHGRNRGLGWRIRQIGGHMKDETLREIARTLSSITIPQQHPPPDDPASSPERRPGDELDTNFSEQYGKGFRLTSEPTSASAFLPQRQRPGVGGRGRDHRS